MVGITQFGFCSRHGREGIDEVGGRVSRAAHFAVVAVLVLGVALRTFALDEAVRQEHVLDRVVILLDGTYLDEVLGFQFAVDALREFLGLVGVG